MSKKEWVKTFLAAAAAIILMVLLGDRTAWFDWIQTLICVGALMAGYYKGPVWGLAAGAGGGLLQWYLVSRSTAVYSSSIPAAAACMTGAFFSGCFRRLGKGYAALTWLTGYAAVRICIEQGFSGFDFQQQMTVLVIFLIVSPERIRNRSYGSNGEWYSKKGVLKKKGFQEKKAAGESAAALAPENTAAFGPYFRGRSECCEGFASHTGNADKTYGISLLLGDTEGDFYKMRVERSWKRMADQFRSLADCFDDQGIMMNHSFPDDMSAEEWKHRFLECRSVIGLQFEQIGVIIENQQRNIMESRDITEWYRKKITESLKHNGIRVKHLIVTEGSGGQQEIDAVLQCRKGQHFSAQKIASMMRTERKKKFQPAYDCRAVLGEQAAAMHFTQKPEYQVLYGVTRKFRREEACSGDSFSAGHIGEGQILLCLADGMGTGRQAEIESRMTVELLEKLLENGFSLEAAVTMTNQVLVSGKISQTPTTLDLCLIDLYSGMAQFLKMGAVAGYLRRGTSVSAIKGQTVPMGMFLWKQEDLEFIIEEKLEKGDMLVFMTDGVSEKAGLASDEILKDLISSCKTQNAQEMADWLMDQLMMLDDRIRDDMTILTAGIWRI